MLYPEYWQTDKNNNYISIGITRFYPLKKGSGQWNIEARTPGILSDYNYSYLQIEQKHETNLGKYLELKYRLIGRVGYGNTPLESSLYLAGAAPETYLDNKITRAAGFVPSQWLGYGSNINHFQMGGGLNLRGYAGYLTPAELNGSVVFNHVGKSGAAFNLELEFDKLIPLTISPLNQFIHIDTYIFHDMGILSVEKLATVDNVLVENNKTNFGYFRTSTGVGSAITFKIPHFDVKPFTLRVDMPLLLNHAPFNSDFVAFRYVVGINRAF
jgi:aminopeptidase N